MSEEHNMVRLDPSMSAELRLSLVKALFDQSATKVNHFDSLRQKNLAFAVAIFAALVGFSAAKEQNVASFIATAGMMLIMVLFALLDHKNHQYHHGWQGTLWKQARALRDAACYADREISFPIYDYGAEKGASLKGLKSCIYFALIGASLLAMIYFAGKWFFELPR